MGNFFDSYEAPEQFESGLSWVKRGEKEVLIQTGTTITVTNVTLGTSKFGSGKQYGLICTFGDEDAVRAIGFDADSVPTRSDMLSQMQAYFESDDAEPIDVKLVYGKDGRTVLIEEA